MDEIEDGSFLPPLQQKLKKDPPKHEMNQKAPYKVQQTTSCRIL